MRARNRVGLGETRGAVATPVGPPGAPASLTTTAGDGEVVLAWSAPDDDGGMPVTGYEYRHASGDAVPDGTPWQGADADLTATVAGLENETRYAFEVRARNRVGPGEVSRATALPLRLRAELFSSGGVVEGEALAVGVRRSGGLAFAAHAHIGVTDNAFPGVSGEEEGRDDGLGRHRLEFAAGEAEATVTVQVAFDGERREDRVLTTTLDSAATEVDGMRRPYEPVSPELVVSVTEGDAGLSVADSRVEGKSVILAFTVRMDRTRDVAVQVDYATEDGSAKAGEDYTAVAGDADDPGRRDGGNDRGAGAPGAACDRRAVADVDAVQCEERGDRRRVGDGHDRSAIGAAQGLAGKVRTNRLGPFGAGDRQKVGVRRAGNARDGGWPAPGRPGGRSALG